MVTTKSRLFRRSSSFSKDGSFIKKKNNKQAFFEGTSHEIFFQPAFSNTNVSTIHRKCEKCEQEDKKVQRLSEKKEDEKLQMKEASPSISTTNKTSTHINALNGKGQSLSKQQQYFFGSRMNYDFNKVKIHTDKEAAISAKEINAKAYTVGNNIVFNDGEYNTESFEGKKLMAHELAHVVQQNNQQEKSVERTAASTIENITNAPSDSGKWNYHNTAHFANCKGMRLHGVTEAHYGDKSTHSKESRTKSTDCPEKCSDCIVETGKLKSTFTTAPTISLPPVPQSFNDCEKKAAKIFLRDTLKPHEQEHARRFNTYSGVVETPYTFTGCGSDLNTFLEQMHNDIEKARRSASDDLSGAIDPFFAVFDCDCP